MLIIVPGVVVVVARLKHQHRMEGHPLNWADHHYEFGQMRQLVVLPGPQLLLKFLLYWVRL